MLLFATVQLTPNSSSPAAGLIFTRDGTPIGSFGTGGGANIILAAIEDSITAVMFDTLPDSAPHSYDAKVNGSNAFSVSGGQSTFIVLEL